MNKQKTGRQNHNRPSNRSLWDRTWKDDRGRVAIWQTPNLPLIAWVVLTILSLTFSGRQADVFGWLGSAALITWSLLEIFKGSSYFRRVLGAVVLVFSIASLIKSF